MIEVGDKVRILKLTCTNNNNLIVGDEGVVTLVDPDWSVNWLYYVVFHKGSETFTDWFSIDELEVVNDNT